MELKCTQALMESRILQNDFDTYLVCVSCHDQHKTIHSGNADEDTLFDIASCGKILHTAPLILQAAGEGLLSPNSTLRDFFCDVPEEKKQVIHFYEP